MLFPPSKVANVPRSPERRRPRYLGVDDRVVETDWEQHELAVPMLALKRGLHLFFDPRARDGTLAENE